MKPITSIVAISLIAAPSLRADLAAYYRFENDFLDSSGGAAAQDGAAVTSGDGTIDFVADVPPLDGLTASIELAGDSDNREYVEVPDSEALAITGDLTLAAWIKPSSYNADAGIVAKYTNVGGNLRSYNLKLNSTGALVFTLSPDGAFTNATELVSNPTVPLGEWTHVAAVFEQGVGLRIFINGIEDTNATFTRGSNPGPNAIFDSVGAPLWIGLQFNPNNRFNYFQGQIDEVRVYNEVLAATEIQTFVPQSVSAGVNAEIALPTDTVTLEGVSLVFGSPTYAWSQASGPDTASISTPANLITDVTLPTPGTYVFQLTADNGGEQFSDTVKAVLYPLPVVPGDIVAHYKFNEGEGNNAHDLSGFKHNAALRAQANYTGGALEGPFSLNLNGNAFAETADTPELSITGELTLSAWVYPTASEARGILAKYRNETGNPDQRAYNLQLENGLPSFSVSSDGTFAATVVVTGDSALPLNQWTHLAGVFEPGVALRIYRNGQLENEVTTGVPASIADTAAPLWIGLQNANSSENRWRGRLDEVRVYSRALPPGDVSLLHSTFAPAPPSDLPVLSPRWTGSQLAIDWTPAAGVTYTMESSETLSGFTFEKTVEGDGQPRTDLFDPGTGGKLFIRVSN